MLILFHVLLLLTGMIPIWPSPVSAESEPAYPKVIQKAYIPNQPSGADYGTLDVVNLSDFTVEKGKITVGMYPNAVGYNPRGTQVFVTHGSSVSIIDPATDTVIETIDMGQHSNAVTFNSDGSKAYVNIGSDLSVIDTDALTVIGTIRLDVIPLAYYAAGNKLYVSAQSNFGDGKLIVINTDNDEFETEIDTVKFPETMAGNRQGTKLYIVGSGDNNLLIIDTATLTVEKKVSTAASQIDVSPDGLFLYMYSGTVYITYDTVNDYRQVSYPRMDWSGAWIDNGGLSTDEKVMYLLDNRNSKLTTVDTETGSTLQTIDLSPNISLADSNRFMASIDVATRNVPTYTVSFDSQGGSSVAPLTSVVTGNRIQRLEPTSPTRDGLKFGGWYKDAEATTRWDFYKDRVTADVTLYAKWEDKKTALLHKAYIPSQEEGALDVVDLEDMYIEKGRIRLGAYKASDIAPVSAVLNPDFSQLFVGNSGNRSVSVIDTTTDTVIKNIDLSSNADGIAFNPDGSKAYVVTGNTVTVIDTSALAVSKTITLSYQMIGSSIVNIGNRMYVSSVYGPPFRGALNVIDTATDEVVKVEWIGQSPVGMTVHPQGTKLYISDMAKYVSVVNVGTSQEETKIMLSGQAQDAPSGGIEISPDGAYLYVGQNVNYQGVIDVIDTRTNTVVKQLQTGGSRPNAINVSLDGATLWVTNVDSHAMSVIDVASGELQSYALSRRPTAKGGFTMPTALVVKLLPKYTVAFDARGGSTVASLADVRQGSRIAEPQPPTLDGYAFAGWYKEEALEHKWNFQSDKVTGDVTLYAKWGRPVTASTLDEPVPGTQKGSTAFETAVDLSYALAVKTSATPIAHPVEGDRLSANEADVIRNYQLQDDVTGVGSRANKYIALYIVDPNDGDRILHFSQFLLYESHIKEDDTALKLITVSPAHRSKDVALNASLVMTFNDPVEAAAGKYITVKGPKVYAHGSNTPEAEAVAARIEANDTSKVTIAGATVTIQLGQELGSDWHYEVNIDRGAFADVSGNGYGGLAGYIRIDRDEAGGEAYSDAASAWSFSTVYVPGPPAVSSFTPANGATNVPRTQELTINFDQNVTAVAGKKIWIKKSSDDSIVRTLYVDSPADVEVNGKVVTTKLVLPESDGAFEYGKSYYVQIEDGAFKNAADLTYEGIDDKTSWTFTTLPKPQGPIAVSYVPSPGQTEVDPGDNLVLTFDQTVYGGQGKKIKIIKTSDASVACTLTIGSTDAIVTGSSLVIHVKDEWGNSCLAPKTEYAVQIDSGAVRSHQSVPYEGINDLTTWSFKTAAVLAPGLNPAPVPEPGDEPNTTKLPSDPAIPVGAGNHLVVKVSSSKIATPSTGDLAPSVGVINPYTQGDDIPGVDPVVNRYIGIYEVDSNNKVVKFTLIVLGKDDVTPKPGAAPEVYP
ncbi:hypothetical protein PA598K_05039, partial [Paenibacillus sp. 598K]